MRHRFIRALVVGLVVLSGLRAEDKKPTTADSAGQVQSRRVEVAKEFADFAAIQQEFSKKYLAAKPEERKVMVKDRPDPKPLVEKAQKLIQQDARDETALDAILFILQYGPTPPDAKLFELTAEYHIRSAKIGPICQRAGVGRPNPSPAGISLLKAALEKNPTKSVKAQACYALATLANSAAEKAEGAAAEKLNQEAEAYFVRIEKEFADVPIGTPVAGRKPTLMGTVAKSTLFAIRNLAIGKVVPEVVSHDLAANEVTLVSLRGKVVVMDFWATWCGPCKAMIPHSRELTEKLKDKPFALVSISSDEKKETLTGFLEKEKMPWTHWWEGNGETSLHRKWGIRGIPTMYILDAKGVIRYKQVGFSKPAMEKMEKVIEDLVKEAEGK